MSSHKAKSLQLAINRLAGVVDYDMLADLATIVNCAPPPTAESAHMRVFLQDVAHKCSRLDKSDSCKCAWYERNTRLEKIKAAGGVL